MGPSPPQIGHAGEGGLYAELVQDRSFDALAAATGFHHSPATTLRLDLAALTASRRSAMEPLHTPWKPSKPTYGSKVEYLKERRAALAKSHDPRWATRLVFRPSRCIV